MARIGFIEVLNPDEIHQIDVTALRILEEVGMWLPHNEVLGLLRDFGARVSFTEQMAYLPSSLVRGCLAKVPPNFTWYARNSKNNLELSRNATFFSSPDSAINIVDIDGNSMPITCGDGIQICRLCDALPNLEIVSRGVHPPSITGVDLDAWHTMTVYTNSNKAIIGASRGLVNSQVVLEMAKVVATACGMIEGKWPLLAMTNTISPYISQRLEKSLSL